MRKLTHGSVSVADKEEMTSAGKPLVNGFSLAKLQETMTQIPSEKDADQVYLLICIAVYIVKMGSTIEQHENYKDHLTTIWDYVKFFTNPAAEAAAEILPQGVTDLATVAAESLATRADQLLIRLYTSIKEDLLTCQCAIAKYTVGTQVFGQTISMAPTATRDVRYLVENLIQQLDKRAYLKIDFINICLRYSHDLDSFIETKKPTKRPSLQPLTHGKDIVDPSIEEIMSLAKDCDMTVPANRSRKANTICRLYKHDAHPRFSL